MSEALLRLEGYGNSPCNLCPRECGALRREGKMGYCLADGRIFVVIDRIKADRRYVGIPVIFLTADNDREAEIQSFKHGALDFITKPFVVDIMMQRVKRILELDRLQKNLQHEVAKQTKKAEERRQKIERMSDQIMEALAGTIDAKDTYTNGHSVRVAEYSREMMRRMGGTEQEHEARIQKKRNRI